MAGKNTSVFGIYPSRAAAEEAIEHLRAAGFRSTDVSVLFPENEGTKDFAHEKNTKAPEGATTGVVSGGIAGGVLGWLTGIGALTIPGLGPLVAAGPILSAVAGAGTGKRPCAQSTMPPPTLSGDECQRPMLRCTMPAQEATMSTMASTAPTS